jgi:hypothetical protein
MALVADGWLLAGMAYRMAVHDDGVSVRCCLVNKEVTREFFRG